jgi:hypothetical protein
MRRTLGIIPCNERHCRHSRVSGQAAAFGFFRKSRFFIASVSPDRVDG